MLFLLLACMLCSCVLRPCVATPYFPDWMSTYSDSTQLRHLNIPGTHNSLALHGGSVAECQSRSLEEQYRMGIRFVDIRCRRYGDSLPIHHGMVFQHAFFTSDAVEPTVRFLRQNPTETVIMLIKQEVHKPKVGTREFGDLVRGSLESAAKGMWLGRLPKNLGEARGKIIVLNKDWPKGESVVVGTHLYFPSIKVYDDWKTNKKNKKWDGVKNTLDRSRSSEHSSQQLYITFASGYTTFLKIPSPVSMAKHVNPKLSSYAHQHKTERLGVVVVDFPERDGDVGNIVSSILRH